MDHVSRFSGKKNTQIKVRWFHTKTVLQLYSLSGYVVFSLSFKEVVIVLVKRQNIPETKRKC